VTDDPAQRQRKDRPRYRHPDGERGKIRKPRQFGRNEQERWRIVPAEINVEPVPERLDLGLLVNGPVIGGSWMAFEHQPPRSPHVDEIGRDGEAPPVYQPRAFEQGRAEEDARGQGDGRAELFRRAQSPRGRPADVRDGDRVRGHMRPPWVLRAEARIAGLRKA